MIQGKLINCKKCGALFVAKSNETLCNNCVNEQNELIENIIKYVIALDKPIFVDELLQKYNITFECFQSLYTASKFIRIANKLKAKCVACGEEISLENRTNFLCDKCLDKVAKNSDKFKKHDALL